MVDPTVLISVCALGVSAIGFFYKLGRDTKGEKNGDNKLDQVLESTKTINRKLDEIATWQREATSIHSSHAEQLKSLFNRMNNIEKRMEDREIITDTLKKILEKVG